ncbi:phosphatase PAP2 family protein [Natronorubrum daqingense]|uniref:PAP2 superfamily protein n=1 Tax=Natronorubrum daqingense TaxID=588898 RepID=A0A1N6YC91_9EURY|nr:phosphatase PAP2 family protein [Natronorubrum daqingense]APX95710.1 phosphatidylglycerophosphatase [Natronorubrum daqingense]SIR12235.1 PAP2 superfamily protein [Natronorubrum daqingense]
MLQEVLVGMVQIVGIMLAISIALFISREALTTTLAQLRSRLQITGPVLVVLGIALLINRLMRQSEEDGIFPMTQVIRRLEGDLIYVFQDIETTRLTMYFSFVYVYGYAYILIFPAIAYFVLSNTRMFRRLLTAYTLNYLIGLSVYLLVGAYGPRQFMYPEEMGVVLYDFGPEYAHVTTEVNRNTNVFPSLHTSLAATVGIFAFYTRSEYPYWFVVALILSISVIISTMYLGIHWAIDVVAGLALAAFCVWASDQLVGRWTLSDIVDRTREALDR